jgi:hypothetical protein
VGAAGVVSVGAAGVVSVGVLGELPGSGGGVVASGGVSVGGVESTGPGSGVGSPHVGSLHVSTGVLGPQVGSSGSHWEGGGGSELSLLSRTFGGAGDCGCEATAAAPADAVEIRLTAATTAPTPPGTSDAAVGGWPRRRDLQRGQSCR